MSIMSWIKSVGKPKPKKYKGSVYSRGLMFNKIHVSEYEITVRYDEDLGEMLWKQFGEEISKAAYIQSNNTIAWNWTFKEV